MCGRDYTTYTEEELFLKYQNNKELPWDRHFVSLHLKPNYNMCPTQTKFNLFLSDNKLQFQMMRWGLVPSWAKTIADADKYSMINAKSEEVHQKRSYANAFKKRRCIVPVSGFFEWKRSGTKKKPYAIYLKDSPIMSLAGIWESWTNKENGEEVVSFALLTTSANTFMEKIHDRMPVILDPKGEAMWLDPKYQSHKELDSLFKPLSSNLLEAHEISTLVNSPRNNSPEVLNEIP